MTQSDPPCAALPKRVYWWCAALVVALIALYLVRGILLPFMAGLALAYFLDPVADKLESFGMKRGPAVLIITLAFMICGLGVLLLILPLLQAQLVSFAQNFPRYMGNGWHVLAPYLDLLKEHLPEEHLVSLKDAGLKYAGNIIERLGNFITDLPSRGIAIISLLSLLVVTPVVAVYLLRDWDHMVNKVNSWLPRDSAPTIRQIAHDIDQTLAGFLRGQATVCLCLAAVYGFGLSFVGLEAGLLVGMVTGFVAFIPYVGSISGFLVAMVLALFQFNDWPSILAVVAVFGVGQTLEGYFLTPKLVGDRIGLHPVWVLFSLMTGAYLFGFLGVLVALPTASVIGVLVRHALRWYLASPAYYGHTKPLVTDAKALSE